MEGLSAQKDKKSRYAYATAIRHGHPPRPSATAIRHINIREDDAADLKRQLRQGGHIGLWDPVAHFI
jgi:hypothetical protein